MPFRTWAAGNDNTTDASGNLFTITLDGTVQAGDVILAFAVQNTGTQTFSISGGGTGTSWATRSGPDDLSANQRVYLWSKTATADSASSTITVTASGTGRFVGQALVMSGDTETGMVVTTPAVGDSTADTTLDFGDVTIPASPASGWDLVVLGSMRVAAATAATVSGVPTGYTLRGESNTNVASPNYTAFALTSNATVGTGTQGPPNGTASDTVTDQLYTVALAPANVDTNVAVPSAGIGAAGGATSPSVAVPVPSAHALVGTQDAAVTASSSPSVPAAAVGAIPGDINPGTAVQVDTAFVGAGAAVPAVTASATIPIPSAYSPTRGGAVGVAADSAITVPSGLAGVAGQPALPLAVQRFQWWDGVEWQPITPLVWDGTGWLEIPVTLTDPTPQL